MNNNKKRFMCNLNIMIISLYVNYFKNIFNCNKLDKKERDKKIGYRGGGYLRTYHRGIVGHKARPTARHFGPAEARHGLTWVARPDRRAVPGPPHRHAGLARHDEPVGQARHTKYRD